jgi:transcriptional regulator with XRE-family HTH domain
MSSETVTAAARNYRSTPPALVDMDFPQRLATIRKDRGLTQHTLAERVGVHVSQIRRYEGGTSTPTLDVLRKLAIALSVSADTLVFDENERGPDDDLRLQFEATARLSDEEKQTVRRVLEGLLLAHDVKHDVKRWAA